MKSFLKFFAERSLLANLIIVLLLFTGISTLINIDRALMPDIDLGLISITTVYPGASPEDVELNVTNKIEKELKSINGIKSLSSLSQENLSLISINLDPNLSDSEKVKDKIKKAVDKVKDLPEEVSEAPEVVSFTTDEINHVLITGIYGTDVPYETVRERARLFEKKLLNLSEVGKIEKLGYRAKEINIEISPQTLEKYLISFSDIIHALKSRNLRRTAGNFESYTNERSVVTVSQFNGINEIGDVIIRTSFDSPAVRMKDVAIIDETFEEPRIQSRVNGKSSISFKIFKNESSDIIDTVNAIKKLIKDEQKHLPKSVYIDTAYDTSKYVKKSFNVLLSNFSIGLILVLFILAVFLNFHSAFWVAMGIPIAVLGTIILMPFFDCTLDILTLGAMILVVGIIVDDAIIIAENIYQNYESGKSPLDAAVDGVYGVWKPVVTTVATTLLVFMPMFFMKGIMGKIIKVMPLTISIALIVSLLESLLILPAHLKSGLAHSKEIKQKEHSWFIIIRSKFKRFLTFLLHYRYIVVPVFIVLFVSCGIFCGKNLKFVLFGDKTATDLFIVAELPLGNSLEATSDKISKIERIIARLPEEELETFSTTIGYHPLFLSEMTNITGIIVNLTAHNERDRTIVEIVDSLKKETDKLEGFENIEYTIDSGPPIGKAVNVHIVSNYNDERKKLTNSLLSFLQNIEGVKDLQRSDKPGKEQISVIIDYDKLAKLGLTVADITRNLRVAYDGEIVTSIRIGDEDVNLRVISNRESRKSFDKLLSMPIQNNTGRLIRLSQVAKLDIGPGRTDVRHYKGERAISIEGDIDQSIVSVLEVKKLIEENFDIEKDWENCRLIYDGQMAESQESMGTLTNTFIIALISIYFLLVLLFNSFTQPLIVLTAVPFGIIGVIIAFFLHGEPLGFMGILGVIGLAGVVVNDSLVLVDHINFLKKSRTDITVLNLIAEGTSNRLRPIILTTLTTVGGLLPLVYGIGGSDPWMPSMAMALGYGLLFATPLTLILLPCLFGIQEDLFLFINRLIKKPGS